MLSWFRISWSNILQFDLYIQIRFMGPWHQDQSAHHLFEMIHLCFDDPPICLGTWQRPIFWRGCRYQVLGARCWSVWFYLAQKHYGSPGAPNTFWEGVNNPQKVNSKYSFIVEVFSCREQSCHNILFLRSQKKTYCRRSGVRLDSHLQVERHSTADDAWLVIDGFLGLRWEKSAGEKWDRRFQEFM